MPVINSYHQFSGRHPETGSVHNILAHQGVKAPHTGQPYSEAFLLGVSGGITFGYFTFDYENYDPILALLIRNTFDPLQTMLERIGVTQTVLQTGNPQTGEKNLLAALENGQPALVWADLFSLPYNGLASEQSWWDMQPVVVYGYDDEIACIADRSAQPLEVPVEALRAARARVKKDKFRVVTLGAPDERKLVSAVQQGIWQCINLFTEAPPKGTRDNFGFAALGKWAGMLTNTRNKQSWARFFPPGKRMFAALAGNVYLPGAYGWIAHWGTEPGADRSAYADFLEEAALLLNRPALGETAVQFRDSGRLWQDFAGALLPSDLPLLSEARALKDRCHKLFQEQGSAASEEIRALNERFRELSRRAGEEFPFTENTAAEFRAGLREHVLKIREQEMTALEALRAALSDR